MMPADDMAKRFATDTAKHEMEILHDDGVYRHLKFMQPGRSMYWFSLNTWPGSLSFTGDMDGYTFSRTTDMFEFFRGYDDGLDTINPQYWGEKVVTGREGLMTYNSNLFRKLVTEHFVEAVEHGNAPRGLGMAVREEILNNEELYYEEGAREALNRFEFKGFRFRDTWEWSFRDYDWSFLWACHAIVAGIGQYDAKKAALVSVAAEQSSPQGSGEQA